MASACVFASPTLAARAWRPSLTSGCTYRCRSSSKSCGLIRHCRTRGVALMANSKEQVCAEKLRSLLRIGAASTRFKDVFDVYYLLCCEGVDAGALNSAMRVLVYDATDMREGGPFDVRARLSRVFNDRRFRRNLGNARNNWLGASVEKVIAGILRYFG